MSAVSAEPAGPGTSGLVARAREGDEAAFRELTDPYVRELHVHCYRMLGSLQDAQDALQESLLAAWRGLAGFEERSSVRTWLYAVTTRRCLNARRAASRRRPRPWDVPGVTPPEPTGSGTVAWLEPLPDALVVGGLAAVPGPEARYEQSEAVALAFVTALQVLPPRQVAVLVLRDVLGFPAAETAGILGSSVESVSSALRRARAGLDRHRRQAGDVPPAPGSAAERALLARFVAAFESADVDAVVALLSDDVFISMPPMPFEYEGRAVVGAFCASLFDAGRRFVLVPTRANGQPAYGVYLRGPDGPAPGVGVYVLGLDGGQVTAMTRFEGTLLAWFGLPAALPDDGGRPPQESDR